ncbi:MAG: 4-hydroxy-3-methylbut-2-enyl diphosphate reductase [Eubacterium sp.]|nr:4-hydroxy-3-methylbut-2-enyl diphosphate reductase [Eubacterium sp.]
MNVRVAKSAGFCFGVKRAVDLVYEQTKENGALYTYGPIIHNEEVVKDLEKKGVQVIDSPEQLAHLKTGRVIIRSHGITKAVHEELENSGFEVMDATCPFVKKIHRIVAEHSDAGEHIVIIGNPSHPEVEGICGWCAPERTTVIESVEDAEKFQIPESQKVCIVSQTTYNNNKFKNLVEIIENKGYYISICILNTICNATEERQTEARALAKASQAMIVIGGKHSSNTQKLFEICKAECKNTYYIQTLEDLALTELRGLDNVGITAGASTPNNIIEEVQKYVRDEL